MTFYEEGGVTTQTQAKLERDAKLLLLERILKEMPLRHILLDQDAPGFLLQFEDDTLVEFIPRGDGQPSLEIEIIAQGIERLSFT